MVRIKFLLVFLFLSCKLFSQDITGTWSGTYHNDTTGSTLPYEIAITESKGKLSGYSYTVFNIEGKEYLRVKTILVRTRGDKWILESDKILFDNYTEPAPKGISMYFVLTYSAKPGDSSLSGVWYTNRTKQYRSVTGTLTLQKKKPDHTMIIPKLSEMRLADNLSFLKGTPPIIPVVVTPPPVKKEVVVVPVKKEPVVETPKKNIPVEPAAELSSRKIETIQSVYIKSDSLILTLYDNGEVDGDIVTVLMNGKVIWPMQGLTSNAINKTIYIPQNIDSVQLIMYAENLGSIPPNTGLLVVRDGGENYEIRFSGDLQRNSAIILKRKH